MIKSTLLLAVICPDSVAVNAVYARQLGHAGDHAIFVAAVLSATHDDPWAEEAREFIYDAIEAGYRPDEAVMTRLLSGTNCDDKLARFALRVIYNTHTNPMRSMRIEICDAVRHVLLESMKREVAAA